MNKRPIKKTDNDIRTGRGCEVCEGLYNVCFDMAGEPIYISLNTDRVTKRMSLIYNASPIPVGYINASYCWRCGRKFI